MSKSEIVEWKRVGSQQIADCRVFTVRRDRSLDPRNDKEHDFFVIEAPDWINVIPITTGGQVILIEQYRHGTNEVTLEIPGGMIDPGEAPGAAAGRELLEETGFSATEIKMLGRTRPNPAIQNNRLHSFVASGCTMTAQPQLDGTEHIAVRLVPLADVPRLISTGLIDHALVLAAFHLLNQSHS